MENQKWDRNEWQGRSKEQIEGNYVALDLIFKTVVIGFLIWAFYNIAIHLIA